MDPHALPQWARELCTLTEDVIDQCWRITDENAAVPKRGSQADGDLRDDNWGHPGADEISPLGVALQLVALRQMAAQDHLEAAVRCLQGPPNPYAVFTVCRSATENALRIRWLLDEQATRSERAARACTERLEDLRWQRQVLRQETDQRSAVEEQRRIVEWATNQGLEVRYSDGDVPRSVDGQSIPPFTDLARDLLARRTNSGELFYRWLSATTHGFATSLLVQTSRAIVDDRTAHQRTPNPHLTTAIMSGAALAFGDTVDRRARYQGWQHSWWERWHRSLRPRIQRLSAFQTRR